jgi:hypothetical protein
MTEKVRGIVFAFLLVVSGLAMTSLIHGFGRPFAEWFVSRGITGTLGKAVSLLVIMQLYFTMADAGLWISYLGTPKVPFAKAVRLWVFMLALFACLMAWWVISDALAPVLFGRLSEDLKTVAGLVLSLAGMAGIAYMAERLGPRFGVHFRSPKSRAA